MGGCTESLLNSVERDLRKTYRSEEGWSLERISGMDDAPLYTLTRRCPGTVERVLVNVRIAAAVGTAEFGRLGEMAARCAEKGMPASRALLVVPQNVTLSADPGNIDLFYLPSYSVRGGEVIWSKSTLWKPDGRSVFEET
ncbi:MAG: hypothetical protein PWP08_581 [Methanofollis sp.]|nr:hypothetical protein [Methanofollis sp.]